MKKTVAGILTIAFVASSLIGQNVYASDVNDLRLTPYEEQLAADEEATFETDISFAEKFESIRGKVLSVTPLESDGSVVAIDEEGNEVENPSLKQSRVLLETEDHGMVNFIITSQTVFPKETKMEEGDDVIGFFNANLPFLMIEPPQYQAVVMAVGIAAEESVFVGHFDENLVSSDNQLKLNISDETEIVYEDGLPFSEGAAAASLENMKLIVLYTVSTRSIPAQTTPNKIIVPYSNVIAPLPAPEQNDGEPDSLPPTTLEFEDSIRLPETDSTITDYPIVVEGNIVKDSNAFDRDGIVMVPLRVVSEALGFDIAWDASTHSTSVNGLATVTNGVDNHQLGAAPEILNDRMYVPLAFFKEVMLVNNAYVFEGQIVINNQEQMD